MLNDLFSIKVYRSNLVKPGTILVLGTEIRIPKNWEFMTKEEKLEWAIMHGAAICINDKEILYAEQI